MSEILTPDEIQCRAYRNEIESLMAKIEDLKLNFEGLELTCNKAIKRIEELEGFARDVATYAKTDDCNDYLLGKALAILETD